MGKGLDHDWESIRLEFVMGQMSLDDLAKSHDIKTSTVRNRASRYGQDWTRDRDVWRQSVAEAALSEMATRKKNEIVKFNEDDLKIANAIRQQIAGHVNDAVQTKKRIPAKDLRLLAGAAESAQKMGRLALGVSTDNHQHTGEGGGPIAHTEVSVEEYKIARMRMIDEY